MKNGVLKISAILIGIVATSYLLLYFTFRDPKPNFAKKDLTNFQHIALSDINSAYDKKGMFKSIVAISADVQNHNSGTFFGQEIAIKGNPLLDKILLGITGNLNSRIELWKNGKLVKAAEKGFIKKMDADVTPNLIVEMYDQTNSRYIGESKISLRFAKGSGFFGDIASNALDLSEYGDLSGEKTIGLFSKSLKMSPQPPDIHFSDLRIWKNWNSRD